MRYAVISDVHANIEALGKVLDNIKSLVIPVDGIYFLGDAVGYGPDPNECIELLRANCNAFIAGNHDRASVGLAEVAYFNEYARNAIFWTDGVLTDENKDFIKGLQLTHKVKDRDILLVHASPQKPDEWSYITNALSAYANFNYFDERFCFIGHSHRPFIAQWQSGEEVIIHTGQAVFLEGSRYIINAGSVGQPRDRDPRACYALVDDEHVEFVRVEYDISKTQNKMRSAGLSDLLINRLESGT